MFFFFDYDFFRFFNLSFSFFLSVSSFPQVSPTLQRIKTGKKRQKKSQTQGPPVRHGFDERARRRRVWRRRRRERQHHRQDADSDLVCRVRLQGVSLFFVVGGVASLGKRRERERKREVWSRKVEKKKRKADLFFFLTKKQTKKSGTTPTARSRPASSSA